MYNDVPCGAGPSVAAVGEVRRPPARSSLLLPVSSPRDGEGTAMPPPVPVGGGGGWVRTCRSVALMALPLTLGGKIRNDEHKMCDLACYVSVTWYHIIKIVGGTAGEAGEEEE